MMTGSESDSDIFSSLSSLGDQDIEAGSNSEYLCDFEREASSIENLVEKSPDGVKNVGVVPDIDKWVGSLARILEDIPQYMCNAGHPGRICRIPENLREIDPKAYEPQFLSIGPYHHGSPRVTKMEKRKRFVLKCFLKQKPELSLKDYLREIKSIEPEARRFYSNVDMETEKFVLMLLLDSLFILPLFCGMPRKQKRMNEISAQTQSRVGNVVTTHVTNKIRENPGTRDTDANTLMMARADYQNCETQTGNHDADRERWFWYLFPHDLFLLENQLPFFVLKKIYALAYGDPETQLRVIMKDRFSMMLVDYVKLDPGMEPTEEVHHLLHLCHLFFRPSFSRESTTCQLPESSQSFRLGSAVQLYEGGVTFEAKYGLTQHSLLDITFTSSGKMVMPCLRVDDNIDSLLRNLIALEQMKYPSLGLHVSAYAVLLLHLVTTPEDVQLLRRKGIIQHHLASDKEMLLLINRLSVGLSFDYVEDNYSLKPLFQDLKSYTEHRKPRWKAWLKHRYLHNPWTALSLLAASLLLIVSLVQTFYTVYSYYHPFYDRHI